MRKAFSTAAVTAILLAGGVSTAVAQEDATTVTTTQDNDNDMSWLGLLGLIGLAGLLPRKRNDHTTTTVRH